MTTIPVDEAVSHRIGALYANYFGRFPVDVATFLHGDLVVCRLHGTLTLGEKARVARDPDSVDELRSALHDRLAPLARETVTRITGRQVGTHMHAADWSADEAVEVFVLDAPPRHRSVPV